MPKKITLPSKLQEVAQDACKNMTNLTEVYFNGSLQDYCSIKWINSGAHPCVNASSSKPVHIIIDENEVIHIPQTTSFSINGYAFYNNLALVSADMRNVTSIGSQAFNGCKNLRWVVCPKNKISSTCFQGCTSLERVYIFKDTPKIEQKAFNLSNPLEVYYEGTEKEWETFKEKISTTNNEAILNPKAIYYGKKPEDMGI